MEKLVITMAHPLMENILQTKLPLEKFSFKDLVDKRKIFPFFFSGKNTLNDLISQRDIKTKVLLKKWKEEFNLSEIKSYNFYNDRLNKSIQTIALLKDDILLEITRNSSPNSYRDNKPNQKAKLNLWQFRAFVYIEDELQNFIPVWLKESLNDSKNIKPQVVLNPNFLLKPQVVLNSKFFLKPQISVNPQERITPQDCVNLCNEDPNFREQVIEKLDIPQPWNGNQIALLSEKLEINDILLKHSKYVNTPTKISYFFSAISGKINSAEAYRAGMRDNRETELSSEAQKALDHLKKQ